jgi:hypothetical protein
MNLASLRNAFTGASIDDIIVTGFLDGSERPVRFLPTYRLLYLECGEVLVKIGVVGDTGRMLITRVDAVACEAELEEEMQPACASLRLAELRDPDGINRVVALHLWGALDAAAGVECAALRIDLLNGQQIFFDPSYYFGIRIGGLGQQRIWNENLLEPDPSYVEIRI